VLDFKVSPQERIIVALDCGEARALALATQLKGHASWLKVGMTLYYQVGPAIVARLKDMGFKVFVDLKLHDIPHQVKGAACALTHAGADMLTMHCSGSLAMLKAGEAGVREAAAEQGIIKPITLGITVLTSINEAALNSIGVMRDCNDQVAALGKIAYDAGLSGIVCSPHEAKRWRQNWSDAVIVTPGIRPLSTKNEDQMRTATPAIAIKDGASHLVVGRPITATTDPLAAFFSIKNELTNVAT
jgi:orotidine-5'-phosphate decarboxylase